MFAAPAWPPGKPFRQAAAVALAVAAMGVVVMLTIVPAVEGYAEIRTKIEEQRLLLGKLRRLAANKEAVERSAREDAATAAAGVFLEGATDALRAASLQALVNGAAERQGVRLRSARTLPPAERDGLRFIAMQAELEASPVTLQALIVEIEEMRPRLFIESLQVAPVDARGRQGDGLNVRIGVAGVAAAPAPGDKGSSKGSVKGSVKGNPSGSPKGKT